MKRVCLLFFFLFLTSFRLCAFTQDEYVQHVLQKDVPASLRWFDRLSQVSESGQVAIYELYQSALPESQSNAQEGISVRGSIERMILLLEGTQYFEQVQAASPEFRERKQNLLVHLQGAKDEIDRFEFGEDPQTLLEEWQSLGTGPFEKFASEVVEVFLHLQKLLSGTGGAAVTEEESVLAFEQRRFESYTTSVETGQVAEECQNALIWKTDRADSCRSDEGLECDRRYARQCKRLH